MPIIWRANMAIDHGLIDNDHRLLIAIINDFENTGRTPDGFAELPKTLAMLRHYAMIHFGREEQLQAAARYPQSEEHQEVHRQMVWQLNVISEKLAEPHDPAEVFEDVQEMLRLWLVEHILKTDLPMRPYVDAMAAQARDMPPLWDRDEPEPGAGQD